MQVLRQKRDIKVEVKLLVLQRGFCRCGLTTLISAAGHRNTRLSVACKLPNFAHSFLIAKKYVRSDVSV